MKNTAALLLYFAIGVACFTGCAKNNEAFTQKSYTAKSQEITEVFVDVRDRQIEVALSDDNHIHIEYFENSKEYYDISVSDGHMLTMTAQSGKEWTDYIGGKSAATAGKIVLQLPNGMLTAIKISTTNETISLPALSVIDEVFLSSRGGNIAFDQLKAGNSITLESKNGDITGTIIGSYDDYRVSCNVKKGKSNLPSSKEDGTKALAISNNNGDVEIEFISE